MSYKNYQVVVNFNDGTYDYNLPLVFHISDPKEGIKATVIPGVRGSGSIIIPGGKRSQEITIRGKLFDEDGYKDLTTKINEMRTKVTTDVATLTLKHYDGSWVNDWQYTVRRIEEIRFPQSDRTAVQEYEVSFLVISY